MLEAYAVVPYFRVLKANNGLLFENWQQLFYFVYIFSSSSTRSTNAKTAIVFILEYQMESSAGVLSQNIAVNE